VRLVELHVILENRFVIPGNPQGAVEVDVPFRPLQQPLVFESLDVGKVARSVASPNTGRNFFVVT
jgi:hypothetical protein